MKILSKKVRRWGIVMAAVLVISSLTLGTLYAQGFWDESKAVHIDPKEIESSTLAIGTHLVHLSALTDAIYEIANASADESGQNKIYYKSELGEDAWFDITNATSLADITMDGAPVTDEEMEALFFTHHTRSDKVTYDLRTGQKVNIFNIRDPYDLENMEELSPLKMFYDQTIDLEGENDITKRIDEIWQTPLDGKDKKGGGGSLLDKIGSLLNPNAAGEEKKEEPTSIQLKEAQLAALQTYLDVLVENEADSKEIDQVSSVMAAVDAGRRYEVFLLVEKAVEGYMEELGGSAGSGETGADQEGTGEGGSEEEAATEGTMDADTPPELLSALAESVGNVKAALITHGGNMLSEGVTIISNAEYALSMDLISHAAEENHAACDADVQKLLTLKNILNNVISDRVRELEMLDNTLIPDAETAYRAVLNQGTSPEYRAAVANKAAQALLNRYISEYESEVNTRRGELEFLIEAKSNRMDAQSGAAFVEARQKLAGESLVTGIPRDDFMTSALASVEEHIHFLSDLMRGLQLSLGGNEMDQLVAEKEELQTQRLEALDNNDLAAAKTLQERIEAIEESIREMEDEIAAQIADLQDRINRMEEGSAERTSAEAELANLHNSLSDGSLGAMVSQLKKAALDGDAGAVDTLAGMLGTAPKLVLPALQEVYNKTLLGNGDQSVLDAIEQAVLDNPNAMHEDLRAEEIRSLTKDWLQEKANSGAAGVSGSSGGVGGLSWKDPLSSGSGSGTSSGGPSGSSGGGAGTSGDGTGSGQGGSGTSGEGSGSGDGTGIPGQSGITPGAPGSGTGAPGDGSGSGQGGGGSGSGTGAPGDGSGSGQGGSGSGSGTGAPGDGSGSGQGGGGSGSGTGAPGDGSGSGQGGSGSSQGSGNIPGQSGGAPGGSGFSGTADTPLTGIGGISRQDGYNTLIAMTGLQMYYDATGNADVLQVLTALAQEQHNLGNPLVFERINDGSGKYLSLPAIQTFTGRRYVWNKNASLGILAQGSDYYGFTVYSKQVLRDRDGEKTEQMSRMAKYQNCVMIPEEYAQAQFGVAAVYMDGSSLACICDDATLEQARELFTRLMQA